MSKLFGTDGIRGIANVELTTSLALKVGKSCAKVLKDEDKKITYINRMRYKNIIKYASICYSIRFSSKWM